jgi:tight adherence protein C
MEPMHFFAASLLVGVGGLAVATAMSQRRVATQAADWLDSELQRDAALVAGGEDVPIPVEGVTVTAVGMAGLRRLGALVASYAPAAVLDRLHEQLLQAGVSATLRAEEFLAVNLVSGVISVFVALGWMAVTHPSARLAAMGLAILTVAGTVTPRVWLRRRIDERKQSIFRDLPDALDLMVISVEAGVSFDAAIQVVADHLEGPLGVELSRTLTEMELGLSRREALQNLRRRCEVPELGHVIVSLLQADALGMPIGRVLRAQAAEMRSKRRQWAREKAGKLPIKILFPLVFFIFPPIMVIVIGPAWSDISKIF